MVRVGLNDFVARIIDINAIAPGTGVSAGGFVGAMSPRQDAVDDLKQKVLALDAEEHKKHPDESILETLYGQVEGGLLGLNALAVIDKRALDKLLNELHALRP